MFRNAFIYINKTLITIFDERDLPDSSINCLLLDKLLTVLYNYSLIILTYTLTSEVVDRCILINLYRLNVLNTSSGDCYYFYTSKKSLLHIKYNLLWRATPILKMISIFTWTFCWFCKCTNFYTITLIPMIKRNSINNLEMVSVALSMVSVPPYILKLPFHIRFGVFAPLVETVSFTSPEVTDLSSVKSPSVDVWDDWPANPNCL